MIMIIILYNIHLDYNLNNNLIELLFIVKFIDYFQITY